MQGVPSQGTYPLFTVLWEHFIELLHASRGSLMELQRFRTDLGAQTLTLLLIKRRNLELFFDSSNQEFLPLAAY